MTEVFNIFRAYCGTCAFTRQGERERVWNDAVVHFRDNNKPEREEHRVYFGHGTQAWKLNDENVNRDPEKLRKMLGEKAQRELFAGNGVKRG